MRKDDRLADRMVEIVIAGVSTRRYQEVLPEMAQTVGVSKSQVSRETIEAGRRALEDLATRDFSAPDLLAVWIDGVQLGTYHAVCAAGVDAQGKKQLLGLREGAMEPVWVRPWSRSGAGLGAGLGSRSGSDRAGLRAGLGQTGFRVFLGPVPPAGVSGRSVRPGPSAGRLRPRGRSDRSGRSAPDPSRSRGVPSGSRSRPEIG
jgi:hypothetical protein